VKNWAISFDYNVQTIITSTTTRILINIIAN